MQRLLQLDDEHVVDAVLAASRAIVALSVRSLSQVSEDMTLTQYRVLVLVASRGPATVAGLADELGVNPSSASRICDRLVRDGLVTRVENPVDRRTVMISPTDAGMRILRTVTDARRREIGEVLASVPVEAQRRMVSGLRQFAAAAGEVPDREWSSGWTL